MRENDMAGRRRLRGLRGIVAAAAGALAWVTGCGESSGPNGNPSDSVIVSNPVRVAATAAINASLRSVTGNAVVEDLVYVALAPGTVPDGSVATIRRVGATNTITASLTAGGLDPVPVVASAGDNIEIVVTGSGSAGPATFTMTVPVRRRPIVVRADPPPKKRDVPLNAPLVVVFNEPVDSLSLSSGVQLFRGNTAVPGTAELLFGTATAAVFRPSVALEQNVDYRLVATSGVRDLTGDPLAANVEVEFTTGQTVEGTPNSIVVVPDTSELTIGSQVMLKGSARDSSGNLVHGVPFFWTSDNPSIASVNEDGVVTALSPGVAHVSGGGAITGPGVATVFVVTSQAPVNSITLTPRTGAIPLGPGGGTVRLSTVLRDSAGNVLSFRQVNWVSSNLAIATVASRSGGSALVTAIATGTVSILAVSEGKQDTATFTVVQPGAYQRVVPGGPNFYNHAHTCGITTDGWVLCWGTNNNGQLGTGTAGSAYTPVGIGGVKFSQLSASLLRTCAVTLQGIAYCWGADGAFGPLGIGPAPDQCFNECAQTPFPVLGGHQFTTIGAGGEHTCALATTGTVYCWGYDGGGLLGIGPTAVEGSPVPVAVPGTFTDLAVGGDIGYYGEHSCVLAADSTAYCWGYNRWGQLGDSSTTDRSLPTRVAGGLHFAAISVGNGHTCGLTADGTAFCWGLNDNGALGTGSFSGPEICQGFGGDQIPCSRAPVAVTGGTRWASISAGGWSTCGIALDQTGYCWGWNTFGQLGDGTTDSTATPTPIVGSLQFASLTAGNWHSCGVTTTGVAYCWGAYSSGAPTGGELGDGSTMPSLVPVKVAGQP